MNDKERIDALERVIAQMLQPIRGIPFNVVISGLCSRKVFKFKTSDPADAALLKLLVLATKYCAADVKQKPIQRPRPNEVGNDIEDYVIQGIKKVGLRTERPATANGRRQSTGYPDILVYDEKNRPTYLECKIFEFGKEPTTMRSFYLSPSETPKVSLDARHLLLAFGMEATAIEGSRDSNYRARSYKLVDLYDLQCDVKHEFNSDNQRLYAEELILSQGEF